jgi:hypothetical protein
MIPLLADHLLPGSEYLGQSQPSVTGITRFSSAHWDTIAITMNTPTKTSQPSAEVQEICDRLKKIGYAISSRIRMYGEEFEVISNPYPDGKGISVEAVSKRENRARVLRIPLPVLQTVARGKAAA